MNNAALSLRRCPHSSSDNAVPVKLPAQLTIGQEASASGFRNRTQKVIGARDLTFKRSTLRPNTWRPKPRYSIVGNEVVWQLPFDGFVLKKTYKIKWKLRVDRGASEKNKNRVEAATLGEKDKLGGTKTFGCIQQAHAVSQNSSNHPSNTSSPSASIHRTNGGMNKGPSPPTTLPTKPSGIKSILTAAQVRMQQAYTDMDGEGRVSVIGVLVLSALSIGTVVMGPSPENLDVNPDIDSGDTAWMLTCTALVLLMTPGLAFFYGGMVDKKNILYTMFQSISAIAMVTCLWTFVGFSLAYGETVGHVIGNPSTFFLYRGVGAQPLKSEEGGREGGRGGREQVSACRDEYTIPPLEPSLSLPPSLSPQDFGDTIPLGLFSLFELKFAIITPPIISGAFTERISYLPYMCFVVLFSIFVYCPIVHAVWHPEGFLRQWGVLDFAGGLGVPEYSKHGSEDNCDEDF
ncbi:hypothetical protein NSK_005492 [Nannochloropsis salina CCMP1776]|uniref:Ammonium transporter AmtB-like domain-containing protein n=1 Tax=Nannochloropsis salina CCMP1776 TaxID=1027361 RepID=A0A4D9D3L9_9STRA|nr:hypothetical protein NSK_005492 [Nannochloropsis salina CCMP1776]|eukprot:TFJ83208.1 hypothetical protein NSK_005492 [Nannochloropsis salina CCMP1776]